ncbi:MAG TPA: hypothetical protein VIM11_18430 [Tepidisphaeraceae bacterium]|jgi:hypothetical protein
MIRYHFILIALLSFALCGPASGLETDQFTTPPRPLVDLGPQLRNHLIACIAKTIDAANARHGQLMHDASRAPLGVIRRILAERADEVLTPDYIAARLYDDIGPGLPECVIEQWLVESSNRPGYQLFLECSDSVYGNVFQRPITLQELSPTVNVYGVYLGTDKIGHFFQQGHEYYRAYREQENAGHSSAEATRAAVRIGVSQEHGFYGEAMVGVYSNGDLAANFAGLQFYLNLTRPLEIRGKMRPPILQIRERRWEFNPGADPEFLSLLFTDHMNESMNVSRYVWYIRDHVRAAARDRGARWAAFYHTSREREIRHAEELSTWFGQDYGHSGFANVFTPADVCFTQLAQR